jgi:hypothetical protein
MMAVPFAGAELALAGLLEYRSARSGDRRSAPCLCTLVLDPQPILTVTKVEKLLSPSDATLLRLDVRRATVSTPDDSTLIVHASGDAGELDRVSDNAQHIFTAMDDASRGSIGTWRQCLAAAGAGAQSPPAALAASTSRCTETDVAEWLQSARDGRRTPLIRAYRAQPALLDARAGTGACLGALHWAVSKAHYSAHHRDCLKSLLHVGASVDLPDARPVLHAARTVEIARLLVAAGADPTVTDSLGRSASSAARKQGLNELAEWLDGAVHRGHVGPLQQAADGHNESTAAANTVGPRNIRCPAAAAAGIQHPPSVVIKLTGIGVGVDGWYILHTDAAPQRSDTLMYIRVQPEAESEPAVLGYRRPLDNEQFGWWYIAAISVHELNQAAKPEAALASKLVAVSNDSAESPEKICAGWRRRTRVGEGTDSHCLRFHIESNDAQSESEGLMIDTVCCGTATISKSTTLCLPIVHRTVVEFLLTTQRWNRLGLDAIIESDSSPMAADIEGRAFLQAALSNLKTARQSRQHEQVLGSTLLAKMEQASPFSRQAGANTCDESSEQQEQGTDELIRQARRWSRRCEELSK